MSFGRRRLRGLRGNLGFGATGNLGAATAEAVGTNAGSALEDADGAAESADGASALVEGATSDAGCSVRFFFFFLASLPLERAASDAALSPAGEDKSWTAVTVATTPKSSTAPNAYIHVRSAFLG